MPSIKVLNDEPGMFEALHGLGIKGLRLILNGGFKDFKLRYVESLKQSILSLKQLETLSISVDADSTGLWDALHGLYTMRLSLSLGSEMRGSWVDHAESSQSLKQSLSSLTLLDTLNISVVYYSPHNPDSPGLWEALHGLSIKSLSLIGHHLCFELEYATSLNQSLSSLTQLETLSIGVDVESPDLWETPHGLNIKRLSLCGKRGTMRVWHAEESFSQSLSSITQLETLTLHVDTFIALQVPRSLKYFNIYFNTLLPSELRELVGTLAGCSHGCSHAIEINLEFGCASSDEHPNRIPLHEYIPIEKELVSRTNFVVKRFRIYINRNLIMPYLYVILVVLLTLFTVT
ncbi:hypothetical protein DPMN_194223 [Dreissena polymorpha]|uniref:Uncharacterized protein n=1 Tax=Dreissena polymorpha TaxID=45954 RepID=A0A9D4B5Z7_DREPO|nr:hypothetical protein DPMN_194223 [Dreissena polymorpha]